MQNSNNQQTEIEDIYTACTRAGYGKEDIQRLIEGLEDRADPEKNNVMIYEAARVLIDYGHFTKDRSEEIIKYFTRKTISYIRYVRNSKKYSLQKTI